MRHDELTYAEVNAHHAEDSFSQQRYLAMAKAVPTSASTILDIGCARGFGGQFIKQVHPTVHLTGMDCCPEKIATLPATYNTGVVCEDLATWLDPAQVDAITSGEMIEHLKPEHVTSFLAACFARLKPGGQLVLTTPNPGYLWFRIRSKKMTDIDTHQSEHVPADLARQLQSVGFTNVTTTASGRISSFLGQAFWHILPNLYGSYMITAQKPQ